MTFDSTGDKLFEPLRNNAVSQRVFNLASKVGDFSVVWHVIGVLCAISSVISFRETLALSLALGCESLIVNQGIKRMFRRDRPTVSGDERFDVRTPSTSSFPSGHASSATCAAIVLTLFTGMLVLSLLLAEWLCVSITCQTFLAVSLSGQFSAASRCQPSTHFFRNACSQPKRKPAADICETGL
jgi:hypothetical protein